MSLSENVQGHKASISSPHIEPYQKFKMEIGKLEFGKKANGTFFISEFEVLETAKTAEINPITQKKVELNEVGTKPASVVKFSGTANDPGPGNVLAFFMALFGKDEKWINSPEGQKAMDDAVSEKQSCEGYPIAGESWTILTKTKKEPFTKIRWSHVPLSAEEKKGLEQAKADRLKHAKIASK